MKIELKSNIINDNYTNYVYEAFDIQNQEETVTEVSFDLSEGKNFDWNIEKNKFDRENNIGLDDVPEIEES